MRKTVGALAVALASVAFLTAVGGAVLLPAMFLSVAVGMIGLAMIIEPSPPTPEPPFRVPEGGTIVPADVYRPAPRPQHNWRPGGPVT